MPGAPPPSEPRAFPEAWDCLFSVHQSFINRTRASLRLASRQGKSRWRALRCKAASLARCCARCVRSRCSRARVPARIAMLSQCVAVVQVCSGVWQPASVVCAHGAMLCKVVEMWLVWCFACVYDGRSVITRVAPRARTRERAGNRLLERAWCAFVLWLVLCAIVGAQHFNLHICVHAAARVWRVCAASAERARASRHRVAWRPGQRACAGRVGWFAAPLSFCCCFDPRS